MSRMNSLVSYESDDDVDDSPEEKLETYGNSRSYRRPTNPKQDDTNYDEVQMSLSEDSDNSDYKNNRGQSRDKERTDRASSKDKYRNEERSRYRDDNDRSKNGDRSRSDRYRDDKDDERSSRDRRDDKDDSRSARDRRDDRDDDKSVRDRRDEPRQRSRSKERSSNNRDDRYSRDRRDRNDRRRSRSRERRRSRSPRRRSRSRSRDRGNTGRYYRRYEKGNNRFDNRSEKSDNQADPQQNAANQPKDRFYMPGITGKFREQIEKRKLLWQKNKEPEKVETITGPAKVPKVWETTTFAQDSDGKVANKFKRLMGIRSTAEGSGSGTEVLKKQEEMFTSMEAQYEVARTATHTMRGVGLGFGSYQR